MFADQFVAVMVIIVIKNLLEHSAIKMFSLQKKKRV